MYVEAPFGVITNVLPLQTLPLLTAMVGMLFTETVARAVLLLWQPAELVPVTE